MLISTTVLRLCHHRRKEDLSLRHERVVIVMIFRGMILGGSVARDDLQGIYLL